MGRIICVDDDKDILEGLRITLEAAGHTIETARDGEEGYRKAKEFKPELIILDVMMTDQTDGFHAAHNLRKDDATKYIPILMLTSINQDTGLGVDMVKDGAFIPVDEFVEKPVSPKALMPLVDKLMKLKKADININGKQV